MAPLLGLAVVVVLALIGACLARYYCYHCHCYHCHCYHCHCYHCATTAATATTTCPPS